MGCGFSSEPEECGFFLGDILETCHGEIFNGNRPSVTLTTSLFNASKYRVCLKGLYFNQGFQNERKMERFIREDHDNAIILAALNGDQFLESFCGTSGVGVWSIIDTDYVIVLGWRIPKYRKVFQRYNILSIGLFLDTNGCISSSINLSLFKRLKMKYMRPGEIENHGNFVTFSCVKMTSGSTTSVAIENDKVKLVAEVSSGRHSRCQLRLIGMQNKLRKELFQRQVMTVKLFVYQLCSCDLEDYDWIPYYRAYKGRKLASDIGYGAALLFEPEGEKRLIFCGPTLTPLDEHSSFFKDSFLIKGTYDDNYSIHEELKHRKDCFGYGATDFSMATYQVGQIIINPENLMHCVQVQNGCNDHMYKKFDCKDWILELCRLVSLDKLCPKIVTLLKCDIKRLVYHNYQKLAQADNDCGYRKVKKSRKDKDLDQILDEIFVPIV